MLSMLVYVNSLFCGRHVYSSTNKMARWVRLATVCLCVCVCSRGCGLALCCVTHSVVQQTASWCRSGGTTEPELLQLIYRRTSFKNNMKSILLLSTDKWIFGKCWCWWSHSLIKMNNKLPIEIWLHRFSDTDRKTDQKTDRQTDWQKHINTHTYTQVVWGEGDRG